MDNKLTDFPPKLFFFSGKIVVPERLIHNNILKEVALRIISGLEVAINIKRDLLKMESDSIRFECSSLGI